MSSNESGISSNTESNAITPSSFNGLTLQEAILDVQNLLEFLRNCEANKEVLNANVCPDVLRR